MKEVLTACLAAIITLVGTWFIVGYQLSEEHQIWQFQQQIVREQKLLESKITVIRSLIENLTFLYDARLNYNKILMRYVLVDELNNYKGDNTYGKELTELEEKLQVNHKRFLEIYASSKSNLRYSRVLFSQNVDSKLDELRKYFESADFLFVDDGKYRQKIRLDLEKGGKTVSPEVQAIQDRYSTVSEDEPLRTISQDLIELMQSEIDGLETEG